MTLINAAGRAINYSHSAAETFDPESDGGCTLKWWYGYVKSIEGKSSASADFGQKCHTLLEDTLTTGSVPPGADASVLKVTLPALDFLPWGASLPMPKGWYSEWKGDHPLPTASMKAKGKVDIWGYDGTGTLVISDLKTSSDPKKWGKDALALATFGQPLLYAALLVKAQGLPVPERFDAHHIYSKTKGRAAAYEVWARGIPWERVEEHWEKADKQAHAMAEVAALDTPEQVPYNIGSCGKFGGCPYGAICPRNPDNYIAFANDNTGASTPMPDTTAPAAGTLAARRAARTAGLLGNTPAPAETVEPVAPTRGTRETMPAPGLNEMRPDGHGTAPMVARLTPEAAVDSLLKTAATMAPLAVPHAVVEDIAKQAGISVADLLETAGRKTPAPGGLVPDVDRDLRTAARQPSRLPAGDAVQAARAILAPTPLGEPHTTSSPGADVTLYVDAQPLYQVLTPMDEVLAPYYTAAEAKFGGLLWSAVEFGKGKAEVLRLVNLALASKGVSGLLGQYPVAFSKTHPLYGDIIGLLQRAGYRNIVVGVR